MNPLRKIRAFFHKEKLDAEMAEEMRAHVELQTQANLAAGMAPDEAAYAARRQFGGMEQIKEIARAQRAGRWLDDVVREMRYSVRMLVRQRGFTVTALGTLALCVGANIAIFAVVDAVILRPLPFPEPDRLVSVFNTYPRAGLERSSTSFANYFDRRGAIRAFASAAIYQDTGIAVGNPGAPRQMPAARISPEFFATLGVPLALGRMFTEAEMVPGSDQVAVLTDGFWRTQFNADPEVLGRTFLNDGRPVTVIGVLPRDFRFLSSHAEFFRPAAEAPDQRLPKERHNNNWTLVARLAPGATLAQAQAELDVFNEGQLRDDPFGELVKAAGYRSLVHPLHADHVEAVKPMLLLLQGGVLLLLLIGTVNLANLLLIRTSGRAKELAVRQALGATRWCLARAMAMETLLLALTGGLLGLGLGALGIRLLAVLGADHLPLGASIAFDGRIALLALAGSIGVGLLLAVPVIGFNLHARLAPGLQIETRGGTASRAAQHLRHGFIVAQVALAFVLLSSAGLLGLSLKRVLETPAGFNSDRVLTGRIALSSKKYQDDTARVVFVQRLLATLRALPGVTQVALSSNLPLVVTKDDDAVRTEDEVIRPGESIRTNYIYWVRGDYWGAMNIPLRRGRFLEEPDNRSGQRDCVVDEAFARRYWPGADPIGRRLTHNGEFHADDAFTVVGVVAEVKQKELAEASGHGAVYFPAPSFNASPFYLVVRTALPPASLGLAVRKAILALDPELPIEDLRTMQDRIDDSLMARRSPAILAGIFAGVAILLAAIGTYGVLAYAVGQRRREIGVRMALGARPRQILTQFLTLGGKLLLAGTVLGLLGAWSAARAMQGVLFGLGREPMGIFALTAALMGAVVLLASFIPSRRAARVSPMEALRAE